MKQDRYRKLFERSEDGILIIVGDKFVDCNDSAIKMLGYKDKEDILNTHPSQLSPEYQLDGSLSFDKANEMTSIAMENGSHRFEWVHMRADGESLPVEVSLTAFTENSKNSLQVILRDITKQKQAEEEKLVTENKLKAIFNHRFQLTGLLAPDGKLLMANQAACNLVGLDCKELEGKYLWELPHWSHSKELQLKVRKAIYSVQRGKVVSFEATHKNSKGEIHFIDFSLTPVRDGKGEIIYIVPEGHDVTTKRESESRLVESERKWLEIYNSSSDAIIIHDAHSGKIVDVNQTMLEMYGYTHQEALQLRIGDISQGEARVVKNEAIERISKSITEGPQLFEWLAKHKNGTCFWVEVALKKTTIGGKDRVLAFVRDITQRKLLDNELRLVKYSIEHSAFPFEWIQDDSRFLYVNEATCSSLGYTREELCSMKVGDIDPDFSHEVWGVFWAKLKEQKSLIFETYHHKKNGEKYPVKIMANYVEFEGKGHVFAYVQDISDRIQHENEQKQLQKQLQQAQKMEAIGTLAGGIAHDFNNILSAIFGYTELAQISVDTPESLQKNLAQILGGAHRAKDLVKQILTFSRKSDQELKPLKAQFVVKEALKLLCSSIPSTIEIKEEIHPTCEAILADPTQVHQIVMNLCTNAYQSMRDKGGVLSVTLRPIEIVSEKVYHKLNVPPGSYLIMKISDSGRGIPTAHLDRIFEPYFTTKSKGEGTGLGLAIVHGIVKSMGGDITVESERGEGTTFNVFFPVIEQLGQEITDELTPLLPTGNERILFVDDDESIVESSEALLESLGYRVTAVTRSVSALDTFQKTPDDFDLVITDVTMPTMTGVELVREIFLVRPNIPIILCTGFSEVMNAKKAKEIGASDYLMKPITRADLAYAVRKVFDGIDGV